MPVGPVPGSSSAPGIVTSNSDVQTQLVNAMMANLKPQDQANLRAAIELQARKMADRLYMANTIRKLGPALTNGSTTQTYALGSPHTFNLSTSLNGYCEGIIVRLSLTYTLAAGAGATYALTAPGLLAAIDTIEVRYNKSQFKIRPFDLRQLARVGALDDWAIPESVLVGVSDATVNAYAYTAPAVAAGAHTAQISFFVPFNLCDPRDARGVLPLMAGDTGIQVIINTPTTLGDMSALNASDPLQTVFYATGGAGWAITLGASTLSVTAVYRDGDTYNGVSKMPFDISILEGTFQAQLDQVLAPLVATTTQRTKLNIMGHHYYVLLKVVDAVQCDTLATQANITYLEAAKDGVGGNVFWRFGTGSNLNVYDRHLLERKGKAEDPDIGCYFFVRNPTKSEGASFVHERKDTGAYLDNTRTGWADWRYGIQVAAVGAIGYGPRIEPTVFYVNPVGLVPV